MTDVVNMRRKVIKILSVCIVIVLATGFYILFSKTRHVQTFNIVTQSVKDHYQTVYVNKSTKRHSAVNLTSTDAVIQVPNGTLSMIEEIERSHKALSGQVRLEDVKVPACKPGGTPLNGVEDLLCMIPPKFSAKYKNPCWVSAEKQFKCLPYFQIIGMDKSGSTDLFDRIAMHPDVVHNSGTLGKETMWWSWRRYGFWLKYDLKQKETFERYTRYFNVAAKKILANSTAGIVTGDGTPMDLWDFRGWVHIPQNQQQGVPIFLTPHLVKHVNPKVKLIIILRDPVERLFSDYFFLGLGKMSSQAYHINLLKSIQLLRDCTRQMSLKMCLFSKEFHKKVPVRIHLGFYSIYLREWLKVFPKEQFYILRTEDYSTNMRHHMNKIFEFLDLRNIPEARMTKVVTSSKKHVTKRKKKATMLPESRAVAESLYRTFNHELSTILQNEKFSWPPNF